MRVVVLLLADEAIGGNEIAEGESLEEEERKLTTGPEGTSNIKLNRKGGAGRGD